MRRSKTMAGFAAPPAWTRGRARFREDRLGAPLGEGAFGVVRRAVDVTTGAPVALKMVQIQHYGDARLPEFARTDAEEDQLPVNLLREVQALRMLCHHANIVTLLDAYAAGQHLVLALEFCVVDAGKLVRKSKGGLPEPIAKRMAMDILLGLDYCHRNFILHRDVKPGNLLVTPAGRTVLSDFGLARIDIRNFARANNGKASEEMSEHADTVVVRRVPKEAVAKYEETPYTNQVSTRWYKSPELLFGAKDYGPMIDIWAAGCVIAELVKGQPLFPGENDLDQLGKIMRFLGTPSVDDWPEIVDLPDWGKVLFDDMPAQEWSTMLPSATEPFLAAVQLAVRCNPNERVTARALLTSEDAWTITEPRPLKHVDVQQYVAETMKHSLDANADSTAQKPDRRRGGAKRSAAARRGAGQTFRRESKR